MTELHKIMVVFTREGVEVAVTYAHRDELPKPGTKTRTARASRMARKGLEVALEGLMSAGAVAWGGYATETKESRDRIRVEGGGGGS